MCSRTVTKGEMMDELYVSYVLDVEATRTDRIGEFKFVSISVKDENRYSCCLLFTDKKTRLLQLEKSDGECSWPSRLLDDRARLISKADRLVGKRVRCSWGDPIVFEGLLERTLEGNEIIEGMWETPYIHWCRVILDDGCAVIVNTTHLNYIKAVK